MAKYTILYKDYLEDHVQPTIFSEIEGFSDLFFATYCDREIGFEVEDTFELKLEALANLVIPVYKTKIENVRNALASITNNKVTTKTKTTDLPIDSDEAEPNQTGESEITGASIGEAIARKKELEGKEKILLEDLLNEFKNLFMLIY